MAWIDTRSVPDDSPAGQILQEHLRQLKRSKPSAIQTVFGLLPDLLAARVKFTRAMTFGGSGLGRRKEELIATQVSSLLGCRY